VIQKALRESGKAGLGEAAFSGREHLIAIMPPLDPKSRGLMAYTMRYDAELRDSADYFSEIKDVDIDKDQLALAKELIRRNTAKFNPSKFVDDYEVALRELIDAKIENQPVPQEEKAPKRAKVINLMDALRKSVGQEETTTKSHRESAAKRQSSEPKSRTRSGGLKLVKPAARRKRTA
ncbi:MAG: Ku protein, partial [Acidobacteriaceae bacterium]